MPLFKKCIYVDDLLVVTFFSCLGAVFILFPPFNETFLRIPFSIVLFFFIPGYAFISALFPGKKEISGIERFTLSIGFSLVLTVFDGFLISLLPWGYRPAPIVLSIILMTSIFSIVALFSRKLLDEGEQFSFSIKRLLNSLNSDDYSESTGPEINELAEIKPISVEKRPFYSSLRNVKKLGLKNHSITAKQKKSLSSEIEKTLIITLIGSIIIASGMFVYAKMTREKETFTMLYLLGPDGKAEGYPTESLKNVPLNVTVRIENHELETVNYIMQMKVDNEVIQELDVTLNDGETWKKNMTYSRQKTKTGRSKLEFVLFKSDPFNLPYRSVHLYIKNNNKLSYVERQNYTKVKTIENKNMGSSTGRNFTTNKSKVSGLNVNHSNSSYPEKSGSKKSIK
jgi:uncharacterized membrane protein